ncbi:MAG TPA: hypothetical protein VFL88_10240 [Gemmatimonadales bacterium]|nr:hypothetical protein [Gemmatimonadales bacterium]
MLVIREVFHCRPGKVRPLVEKFQEMAKLMPPSQTGGMRILTDFAGERYWTAVFEMQVASMAEFEKMMSGEGMSEEDGKKMEKIMDGYHDLVDHGHREIFKIE